MISEQDITGLFQNQLEAIQNKALRKKVVQCWVLGCERGGWQSVNELKQMDFTLLTETGGINLIDHTIAVTEGAAGLARAQIDACASLPYTINFDRLFAGGLLHDVGKLLEIESDGKGGFRKSLSGKYTRHPISGALLAAECGLGDDIINTIACHSKEGDGRPQVVETVLIHQADFGAFNPLVMKQKGLLIA
jgi:putative nucleotidyltransferase with HDIG domain